MNADLHGLSLFGFRTIKFPNLHNSSLGETQEFISKEFDQSSGRSQTAITLNNSLRRPPQAEAGLLPSKKVPLGEGISPEAPLCEKL